MEKFFNENEKIRKAEAIYLRRNCGNNTVKLNGYNQKNKKYMVSKLFLELLILIITAVTVFAIKNREFIFSEKFLEKVRML